jgi:outer membrane protein assembly factor BamB
MNRDCGDVVRFFAADTQGWVIHRLLMFGVLCCLVCPTETQAADWPQFLGIDRTGISSESGLLSAWPEAGPRVLWRKSLGTGMSGLAVMQGTAYTLFQDQESQYLVALSVADGNEIWKCPVSAAFENSMGNGPRSTPTVSGDRVIAYSADGVLVLVTRDTGKVSWSVDVLKLTKAEAPDYGISCSPLVVGENVIVHAGGDQAAVVAFDVATGEKRWAVGRSAAGYSSPMLMQLAGRKQVVAFCGSVLLGIDPESGKQLWEYPFETDFQCNTANPVQVDSETILISSGENHGTAVIKIQADGASMRAEEVWTSFGRESQLRAEWQTPVIVDGYLYGLDNVGAAGPVTNLVCIRMSDHRTMWKQPRFGKSNLIAADGKLFLTTVSGELVIVKATPDEFRELSRVQVMQGSRQAPCLSDQRLFLRDHEEVICVHVAAAASN